MKKNLTITETDVVNVISYILSLMKKKNVDCNIETCAELILIARILNQRFNITDGLNIEQDPSLILAPSSSVTFDNNFSINSSFNWRRSNL